VAGTTIYASTCASNRTPARRVVVVINGRLGSGFSVQGHLPDLRRLPDMLDNLALAIRLDVGKMDSGQGA
jgi:hypothetical protein